MGGEFERLSDEVFDRGRVEESGGFEDHVTDEVAAAAQEPVGIAEAQTVLQKEEADPARIEGDGEEGVRSALGRAEADGESVVVVVDEFLRTGQTGAEFAQSGAGLGGDVGRVLVEESIELGDGGDAGRMRLCADCFARRATRGRRGFSASSGAG